MLQQFTVALALAGTALSAPSKPLNKRAPTVWIAGDSTTAEKGGGSGTQGWGHFLSESLDLTIQNKARAGRSSRSYTVEGRFDEIAEQVQSGDYVIIEFGHNDGGSLSSSDNGRTVCPGGGSEVCQSNYNGENVQVLTFNAYLLNAGKQMIAKGANVIMSSQTPNNPWESGSFTYTPSRFVGYAETVAKALGGTIVYVDHGQYVANRFEELGKTAVDAFFPNDHTHTSEAGGKEVEQAFVRGLICGNSELKANVKDESSIPGTCI